MDLVDLDSISRKTMSLFRSLTEVSVRMRGRSHPRQETDLLSHARSGLQIHEAANAHVCELGLDISYKLRVLLSEEGKR